MTTSNESVSPPAESAVPVHGLRGKTNKLITRAQFGTAWKLYGQLNAADFMNGAFHDPSAAEHCTKETHLRSHVIHDDARSD